MLRLDEWPNWWFWHHQFGAVCGKRLAIQLFLRQKGYSAQSRTTNTENAKLVPKPSTKNAYPHVNREKKWPQPLQWTISINWSIDMFMAIATTPLAILKNLWPDWDKPHYRKHSKKKKKISLIVYNNNNGLLEPHFFVLPLIWVEIFFDYTSWTFHITMSVKMVKEGARQERTRKG